MATYPIEIQFHNLDHSPAVEERVREKAEKLGQFFDGILYCHVWIEMPHKQHEKGNLYNVKVQVEIPNHMIHVAREKRDDLNGSIRDAFDAARRQLTEQKEKMRGDTKTRPIDFHRP